MNPALVYLLVCALSHPTGDQTVLNKHVLSTQAKSKLTACDTDGECESAFHVACLKLHPHYKGVEGWLETYPAVRGGR